MMHDPLDVGRGGHEVVLAQDMVLVAVTVIEDACLVAQPPTQPPKAYVRAGGQAEGEDDARKRRMDTRVVHAQP